jgi:hypothetical protein
MPGALGDPPELTVKGLVAVPKVPLLPALNMIEVGDAPEMLKVPLPTIVGPLGGLGTIIVFQVAPASELN